MARSEPSTYVYDPTHPTPTLGGKLLSSLYRAGSVDVSSLHERPDVITFTTAPLRSAIDVVGTLRLVLYASSNRTDTDFFARLSDVWPDGRAIELQSGAVRARYHRGHGEPELIEPGAAYCYTIEMWATANRFAKGHRIRLDICSSDFPRLERNANRGGEPGAPVTAAQTVYHDAFRPSCLLLPILQ